ncbi:MAG: 16S rRNA (cytosine(967)-C(5))-methyltransferase RsmB [Clostridia bacterium]|nr:16S rRNA (cytosine(967)-C(5))-methyltransferase RsmB [Clostridia bacterium]
MKHEMDKRQRINPRMVAVHTLQDVSREGAYASIALGRRLRESGLAQRDKDLVTEIVYGTLEKKLSLDYLLERRIEKPNTDNLVRDILRMGAYQIVYLDRIPDRASVDESVKLARILGREAYVGFINGVLRGIARDKDAGALGWPDRTENPVRYLSILHSVPEWLVRRLIHTYGLGEAEQIVSFKPDDRYITIRRTPDRQSAETFEAMMTKRGWRYTAGYIPGVYHVTGIGDVGLDRAYLNGEYSVQSESSMLAAMAVSLKHGGSVLDACAAPGGKTACLSEQMAGTGRVYAWDIHEHRVELIRNMVKRLRLYNIRPAIRDATVLREDLRQTMDAVLIDAPCTGFGVMLNKPDVKYRQTEESVLSLAALQRAILNACCTYVKPGGLLVYATCTLLPEENTGQVQSFLEAHPEFEPDGAGLRASLPGFIGDRIDGCMLQLQAYRDMGEGFFIARMKRRVG